VDWYVGPYQLAIVTFLLPFVYVIMVIFYPLAYPMSKVLDYLLGNDEKDATYSRHELRTMVRIQHEISLKEKLQHRQRVIEELQKASSAQNPLHATELPTMGGYAPVAKHDIENQGEVDNAAGGPTKKPKRVSVVVSPPVPGVILSKSLRQQRRGTIQESAPPVFSPLMGSSPQGPTTSAKAVASPAGGSVDGPGADDVEAGHSMAQEVSMLDSVLTFRDHIARDVMTPEVFMMCIDDVLNEEVKNLFIPSLTGITPCQFRLLASYFDLDSVESPFMDAIAMILWA
jgi:hypothetical protein